ncbi:MAG: hypothetical protein M1828_004802 [Chrysothrix sp. TS-e1954]|nr:MAG: hypothetical protein M1828_004802 [Chrysothrix sp. TS-e1954]
MSAFTNLFSSTNDQSHAPAASGDVQNKDAPSNDTPGAQHSLAVRSKSHTTSINNSPEHSSQDFEPRTRPLKLLNIPYDCLKLVLDLVVNTHDLAQVALTCKTLHRLAIPLIYSRFDIVWPDPSVDGDDACRTGVDALTHGLTTLVMREDVFTKTDRDGQEDQDILPRRGNSYGQHCRKFAIANGPWDQVQDYMFFESRGKMLGTLVALAVARMENLAEFSWDMPTGIVREVWTALASLGQQKDVKLENVRVRIFDKTRMDHLRRAPRGSAAGNVPKLIEQPSFSILPPLTSLAVLDIDDRGHLDEISVLIARSRYQLRTLKISLSRKVTQADWVCVWTGEGADVVFESERRTAGEVSMVRRVGGAMGSLLSRLARRLSDCEESPDGRLSRHGLPSAPCSPFVDWVSPPPDDTLSRPEAVSTHSLSPLSSVTNAVNRGKSTSKAVKHGTDKHTLPWGWACYSLKLETLQLERLPLAMPATTNLINWHSVIDVSLLDCPGFDQLWHYLHQQNTPREQGLVGVFKMASQRLPTHTPKLNAFGLQFRKVHVNQVTSNVLDCLTDALAPDTLERLFLQDSAFDPSTVSVDKILRGPLKRHRGSLQQVIVDSSRRYGTGTSLEDNNRWAKWLVGREGLRFLFNGKMLKLRELCFCMYYKDWHFLLQNLPNMPQLEALYIPSMSNAATGDKIDPQELALQVLDVITIRPEIRLKYLAISNKCFEFLEETSSRSRSLADSAAQLTAMGEEEDDDTNNDDDDDGMFVAENGDDEAEDEEEDDDHDDESETSTESDGTDLCSDEDRPHKRIRIRPILFYDLVSIFKARHMTL